MRKSTVSLMVSSIILSACGGGGGDSSSTPATSNSPPATTQSTPVEPVELFATTPILLPDLKAKYDRVCGRNTHVQHAIVVDINKDGRMDLVFNLWCLQPNRGAIVDVDTPVPNGLIALVQDSNGKFVDKTLEVFGNDLPSIGGIGIDYVANDFNGDGVKDIVFAVNREDGRLPDKGEVLNHKSNTVALMSDGIGGYKITNVSKPEYGYRVVLKENNLGKFDLITLPFEQPNAYTYNNGWSKLSGYDWIGSTGPTFFGSVTPGLGSTIAVVPSTWPRTGVALYSGTNNSWSKIGEYKFPEPILVYMKQWTGATDPVPMFTIDGKDYVTPSILDTCELKRTKNSPSQALAVFLANEVVGGYKGQILDDSDEKSLKGIYKLMLFDVNNGNALTKIDIEAKNEVTTGIIKKVECPDINDDGLSDILYYQPMGGPPDNSNTIYPAILVNDGEGNYNRIANKWFPRPGNGVSYVYEDLNNDGYKDLLYFPLTGYTGHDTDFGALQHGHLIKENSVTYYIYLGKRKIKSSDMM
jgi:hypothetical protein